MSQHPMTASHGRKSFHILVYFQRRSLLGCRTVRSWSLTDLSPAMYRKRHPSRLRKGGGCVKDNWHTFRFPLLGLLFLSGLPSSWFTNSLPHRISWLMYEETAA